MPLLFRAVTLVLFLFKVWKRLPASQRRRMLWAAGRQPADRELGLAPLPRARLAQPLGAPSASRTIRSCSCWCTVG